MLRIEDIKNLDGEVITEEQFEEIETSEYVVEVENCGNSGRYNGKVLYTVYLVDGEEIEIYG